MGLRFSPASSLLDPPEPLNSLPPLLANPGAHWLWISESMRTSTVEPFDRLADFDIFRCIFDTPPPPCPTLSPSIALPDANLQPFPPVPQPWPTPFSTGANPGVERPGRLLVSYGRATFPPTSRGREWPHPISCRRCAIIWRTAFVVCQRGPRCASRLHGVQRLANASEFVLSQCA